MGASFLKGAIAVALPLKYAGDEFMRFEQAMARTRANSEGLSDEAFGKLTAEAKRMGLTTQSSAADAARAMATFAKAGWGADKIMKAIRPTTLLAAASFDEITGQQITAAQAADYTIKAMSGLGLSIEQLPTLLDVMAKAARTANTELPQLSEALNKVGSISDFMGVQAYEVIAALQLLSDRGMQAEEAGTNLRSVLVSLVSPSREAAAELDRLGVKIVDANGNFRGLANIIDDLEQGMKRLQLGTGDRGASMATIFHQRQANAAANLFMAGSAHLRKYTNNLRDSRGELDRIANIQLDTMAGAVKLVMSSIQGLAIAIGEGLQPVIRPTAQAIMLCVNSITAWAEANPRLFQTIAQVTVGVAAAGAAMLALGTAVKAAGVALTLLGVGLSATKGLFAAALLVPVALSVDWAGKLEQALDLLGDGTLGLAMALVALTVAFRGARFALNVFLASVATLRAVIAPLSIVTRALWLTLSGIGLAATGVGVSMAALAAAFRAVGAAMAMAHAAASSSVALLTAVLLVAQAITSASHLLSLAIYKTAVAFAAVKAMVTAAWGAYVTFYSSLLATYQVLGFAAVALVGLTQIAMTFGGVMGILAAAVGAAVVAVVAFAAYLDWAIIKSDLARAAAYSLAVASSALGASWLFLKQVAAAVVASAVALGVGLNALWVAIRAAVASVNLAQVAFYALVGSIYAVVVAINVVILAWTSLVTAIRTGSLLIYATGVTVTAAIYGVIAAFKVASAATYLLAGAMKVLAFSMKLVAATATGLAALVATLKTIAATIALLVNPATLVAAALAGMGYAFFALTDAGKQAASNLKASAQAVGSAWRGTALRLVEDGKAAFAGIQAALMDGDLESAGRIAWAGLLVVWAELKSAVILTAIETWDALVGVWGSGVASLRSVMIDFQAWIDSVWAGAFGERLGDTWEGIKAIGVGVWDAITTAAGATWDFITSAVNGIVSAFTGIGSLILAPFAYVFSFLQEQFPKTFEVAASAWRKFKSAVSLGLLDDSPEAKEKKEKLLADVEADRKAKQDALVAEMAAEQEAAKKKRDERLAAHAGAAGAAREGFRGVLAAAEEKRRKAAFEKDYEAWLEELNRDVPVGLDKELPKVKRGMELAGGPADAQGTFNAAVASMLGSSSVSEAIKDGVQRTANAVEKIEKKPGGIPVG